MGEVTKVGRESFKAGKKDVSITLFEDSFEYDGEQKVSELFEIAEEYQYIVKQDRGKLKAGDVAWGRNHKVPTWLLRELLPSLVRLNNKVNKEQFELVKKEESDDKEDIAF